MDVAAIRNVTLQAGQIRKKKRKKIKASQKSRVRRDIYVCKWIAVCCIVLVSLMAELKRIAELRKESELIDRAYRFARHAHAGQKRLTGEPYFNHALKTAEYLAEWGLDETTIAAGLLHDTVEDTDVTIEDIGLEFGEDIKLLIDGVTKLGKIKYRGGSRR